MNNKIFLALTVLLIGATLIVAGSITGERPDKKVHLNSQGVEHQLVSYKSPTCGCCINWIGYMRAKGYKVDVVDTDTIEDVKKEYNVPEDIYSCHTTIVNGGEYFIEGHIPEESISRMLEEQPDIMGIGMPGMPSGSPGMPGAQEMPFQIMQLEELEKLTLFEEI